MRLVLIILISMILSSCEEQKKTNMINSDIRKEILGRDFSNSEVFSIDIVKIEHPMLGGIIETTKLSKNDTQKFLADFDSLKKKGMYKCGANYVIQLNMESDTLRLKVCGTFVANRTNDMYYEFDHERNIIEEYL